MKIITIPHSTLRTTAQPVTVVDKKLRQFIRDLEDTLAQKENPRGVGLAAPQVDVKWRIFATQLPSQTLSEKDADTDADKPENYILRHFINPEIIDFGKKQTLGPNKRHPTLEGCLSIPGFYGPVPRWEKIQLRYQEIQGEELVTHTEVFADFAARVVQHEQDHLNGILFIDYIAKYDLPLYEEDKKTEELKEMDSEMVQAFVAHSK